MAHGNEGTALAVSEEAEDVSVKRVLSQAAYELADKFDHIWNLQTQDMSKEQRAEFDRLIEGVAKTVAGLFSPANINVKSFDLDIDRSSLMLHLKPTKDDDGAKAHVNIDVAKQLLRFQYAMLRAHELIFGASGTPLPKNFDDACAREIELAKVDLLKVKNG